MNTIVNSKIANDRFFEADIGEDFYPSRNSQPAEPTPRHDPVVYASDRNHCPVNGVRVDRAAVDQYEQQGFLILEDVFSKAEVDSYSAELTRLREDELIKSAAATITEPSSHEVRSVFSIHTFSRLFQQLAADPRLSGLAQYLLHDNVYLHQSRANYKPGFHGQEFFWHSDFETWHIEDGMPAMRALSMSIALTENFDHNGPLMLIPGSHKTFIPCSGKTPDNHYQSSLKKQRYGVPDKDSLDQLVKEGGIVSATGKPGSVTLFDCNLMHGSNGNITPLSRSNVFFVYNALSNQVGTPYCQQPPRPEYICSRNSMNVLPAVDGRY